MILWLALYLLATVILVFIEKYRIDIATRAKKQNINHGVSVLLAVIAAGVIFALAVRPIVSWPSLLFLVGCVGIRLLIYDPLLNLIRHESLGYVSGSTDAKTEHMGPFLLKRTAGAIIISVVIFIYYKWVKS